MSSVAKKITPNKGIWTTCKLKYILRRKVSDGPHETPVFTDIGIPFLSVDGIQNGELVFEGCRFISVENHNRYKNKCPVEKNDVLLGKAASIGKIAQVKVDFPISVWSPLAILKPDLNRVTSSFLEYCLKSTQLNDQIEVFSTSNTQKNISMDDIQRLDVFIPPLKEQKLIARYLDKKTEQIDLMIEKIQKKIELLKEQRTSLINQCVTKGLDPNAPMKDSGVEWISDIPKHWDVTKLKRVSSTSTGTTPLTSNTEFYDGGATLWIKPGDLQSFKPVRNTEQKLTTSGVQQSRLLDEKSILVCGIGTIGKFGYSNQKVTTNQQINGIIFDEEMMSRDFGLFLISSMEEEFVRSSEKVVISILSKGRMSELFVPVPPIDEQLKIAKVINSRLVTTRQVTERYLKRINLLKEYRQALISSVVTGKVRITEDML